MARRRRRAGGLIVLVGWFGVIGPELSAAAADRDQAETAQMQNVSLQAKNAKLKAQNDDVAALRAEPGGRTGRTALRRRAAGVHPPSFRAGDIHVDLLTSIVVGPAAPVAQPAVATASGNTDAGTTATSTAPTSDAAAGLLQMEVTLTATGLGPDLQAFLNEIQTTGPRRALVNAVQLVPVGETGGSGGDIKGPSTLNLSLIIFTAPLTPDAQAALEKLLSGN